MFIYEIDRAQVREEARRTRKHMLSLEDGRKARRRARKLLKEDPAFFDGYMKPKKFISGCFRSSGCYVRAYMAARHEERYRIESLYADY